MTDIDILSNTTASALSGGVITNTYFVSNSAILRINADFQCEAIVLGRNIAGAESAGFLDCESGGRTITFGAGKLLLSITPSQHIWLYGGTGVRDDGTTPTEPNDQIIFTRQNQSEFLRILYIKGTTEWSVKYYRLKLPAPIIVEFPSSANPNNARNVWFDPLTFGEFSGASTTPRTPNIGLIARRGHVSRTEHRGFSPQQIGYTLQIDDSDNGAIQKLEDLLESGGTQDYFIVTDREVLIDYVFSGIEGINRIWEKDTTLLKIGLGFQEKIL